MGSLGCYIWYSEEGPGLAAAPPSPLLAVPNVTAHPSTASVPITALLSDCPLLCCSNVAIKGLSAVGAIGPETKLFSSTSVDRFVPMMADYDFNFLACVLVVQHTNGPPLTTKASLEKMQNTARRKRFKKCNHLWCRDIELRSQCAKRRSDQSICLLELCCVTHNRQHE